MKLPVWAITVTPFSKRLALFLYIFLPFAGFYLGMHFQGKLDQSKMQNFTSTSTSSLSHRPTITLVPTIDPSQTWESYATLRYTVPPIWKETTKEPTKVILTKQSQGNNPSGGESLYTSTITLHVEPAESQTIERVLDSRYMSHDPKLDAILKQYTSRITIDGIPALYIYNLPGTGAYDGEGLVFIHNNKLYDITLNGWTGDKKDFTLFMKSIRFTTESSFTTTPTIPAGGTEGNAVMCTQEAKICPNGSAVGRTGPKCEFAPCPSNAP